MLIKHLVIQAFMLLLLFGAAGSQSYSQDNETGGIKITLPVIGIVIGDTYDQYGYDRDGYDRYGYDRYGYDRSGYNKSGYDRYGYDRYGYDREGYDRNGRDRYGNYRQSTTYYGKKHHDNGKHKGWYKHNDDGRWEDHDGDRDDD